MKKLSFVLVGLLSAIPAFAEVVTYEFTGVINTIRREVPGVTLGRPVASADFVQGKIAVGHTFHGSFSYDTSLPLNDFGFYSVPWDSSSVVPASVLTLDASGAAIVSGTRAPSIFVDNDDSYADRVYIITANEYLGPRLNFAFYDYTGTALSSGAIPGELSLDAFWHADADVKWTTANGTEYTSTGMFTSLTRVSPVPEPESFGMMIAGLGVLAAFARRRKQAAAAL